MRVAMFLCCISFGTTAAADTIKVTVSTQPSGATILVQRGGPLESPSVVTYELYRGWLKQSACTTTQPLTIQWVSGASLTTPLRICPSSGKNQHIFIARPTGVPGLELDIEYGLRLAELRAAEQTNRRESARQAWRSFWTGFAEMNRRQAEILQATQPIRCTSNWIGTTLYTTCS